MGLGKAGIHPVEIGGEKRGFVASGAGADFHDGVAVLVRVGGEERVLHGGLDGGDAVFEIGDFGGGHFGKLGVVSLGERLVFGEFATEFLQQLPIGKKLFQPGVFAQGLAGFARIVVEIRRGDLSFEFAEAVGFAGDERSEVHGKKRMKDEKRAGSGLVCSLQPADFSLIRKKQNGEDALGIFTVSEVGTGTLGGLFARSSGTVAAGEFLDAAGGIDELLLAGEERVAGGANADPELALGAAGVVGGAAGAADGGRLVVGMNICFHGLEKGVGA